MSYSKIKIIRLSAADKQWSGIVRKRDGKCAVCGSVVNLAAHHIEGRAKKATRLLVENGITLCPSHHVFNNDFSAHRTPKDFKNWFIKTFPKRWKIIQDKLKSKITEREAILEFQKKVGDNYVSLLQPKS